MGRFIIVTFLLLGWGFFELSGGMDFQAPAQKEKPLNALLEQVAEEERTVVARAEQTPATAEIIGRAQAEEDRAQVTLASFSAADTSLATVLGAAAQTVTAESEAIEAAAVVADIRAVSGSRVNMRNGPGTNHQVLSQLLRGTEAEVLQEPGNGWVKIRVIDGGRIGWMAARLMTPVN